LGSLRIGIALAILQGIVSIASTRGSLRIEHLFQHMLADLAALDEFISYKAILNEGVQNVLKDEL